MVRLTAIVSERTGYPEDMLAYYGDDVPDIAIASEDLEMIAEPIDWLGINYYERHLTADEALERGVVEVVAASVDSLLEQADAIVVGTGTRFGRMTSQMASFLDQAGGLWASGALNGKVGGAESSYHTKCEAADFYIPGVSKRKLIAFAHREKLVGGLGCYPGRQFIHIDVRDRPRGWRKPVTFSGC